MNTRSWMHMDRVAGFARRARAPARPWVRRSRGRRASDQRPSLETILASGVILAWAWGIYEVTLLFLR